MNWISKLERKFGRYAIQNLMFYVIAFVTEHRSGVSRADLEVSYIFDAAAKFECVVYGVCIVFILYDRTSA